jgi:hypothetical protein
MTWAAQDDDVSERRTRQAQRPTLYTAIALACGAVLAVCVWGLWTLG